MCVFHSIVNELLGLPTDAVNYVELLNQLSDAFSSSNLSDKPIFRSQLNSYVQKNWDNLDAHAKNEKNAKYILIELSNQAKLSLVHSEKYPHSFFTPKNKENYSMYQFLAHKEFNSLILKNTVDSWREWFLC